MVISKQLKQRLFFGSLGIIAAVLCIYFSATAIFKPIFVLLNAGIISLALLEYYHLTQHKGFQPLTFLGIACSIVYVLTLGFTFRYPVIENLPSLVLLASFIIFFLVQFNHNSPPLGNLAVTIFGVVYLTIPLSCALRINHFFPADVPEDGRMWLGYILIISKMTDIGGYICGKTLGKNKLAPIISPKKTVEGAVGGMIAALIASVAFSWIFPAIQGPAAFKMTLWQSIWLGLIFSILAQLGDLTESLLKRDAGVKDSSRLPGFGGIFDVVDSLVFTLPLMYLLLEMGVVG